jgi:hypothetical protein
MDHNTSHNHQGNSRDMLRIKLHRQRHKVRHEGQLRIGIAITDLPMQYHRITALTTAPRFSPETQTQEKSYSPEPPQANHRPKDSFQQV